MPDNTTSHEKQRTNKRALSAPNGSAEAEASKRARTSGPTKQDLVNELRKVNEELQKIREENKKLQDAAAEAERDRTKETQRKIPVPRKHKNQKGPSHAMGDIVQLLEGMPDVEDAEDYYSSAQRYMKVAIKAANLDLTRTYKNCQDEPQMATACKLIRKRFKAFENFENDWASRCLIKQYMKSVRSNAREILKRKAKRGPSKVRARKTILANFSNDPAQTEGEDTGEEDEEDEEDEGVDREA